MQAAIAIGPIGHVIGSSVNHGRRGRVDFSERRKEEAVVCRLKEDRMLLPAVRTAVHIRVLEFATTAALC